MKTTEAVKVTDRQIRQHVLRDSHYLRCRVCRNGHVHAYTTRPRGDGGPIPWWTFAGFRETLANEVAEERREAATVRLEYLRGEIEAERISYEEIAELQDLVPYIEPGDVLLLEWAGVPETVN